MIYEGYAKILEYSAKEKADEEQLMIKKYKVNDLIITCQQWNDKGSITGKYYMLTLHDNDFNVLYSSKTENKEEANEEFKRIKARALI
jgi:uracil-DNA glycosylase